MNFWEDKYRVEEDGSVYNIKSGKLRKPRKNKKGYETIGLYIDGKIKQFRVNRLVALTYIPNEDNKMEVDHIDRNKQNNHFTNLRWVTHLENMQNLERGETGELNIIFDRLKKYKIQFRRNKLIYYKYLPIDYTLEQAVIQRDLMLSMF